MKLLAYKISGTPVNELPIFYSEDLNGNEPYKISNTVENGYEDISSIDNWFLYGFRLGKDYKFIRNEVIILTYTIGWGNLSSGEKLIAAKEFCVPLINRSEIYTLEEQIINGRLFHKKSTESRQARKLAAEVEIYNRITNPLDIADLLSTASSLMTAYVEFGVEGTLEGDHVGLFDFLESRSGTDFENTGLLSKTYIIDGMTVAELSTKLMDILKNGNY